LDWKKHKAICKIMKDLSNDLQPYRQVLQIIKKIVKPPGNIRVLRHLLHYAKFQFGDRIPGKAYRRRENGERISNLHVEIYVTIPIYKFTIHAYRGDTLLSIEDRDNEVLLCLEGILEVLKPWSLSLDMDAASRIESLSKDHINAILELLSDTEQDIAKKCMNKCQFGESESHCQRALAYARRYDEEGKRKTTLLLNALTSYSQFQIRQGDLAGATTFAEEAYNWVAIAYNPVHLQVLEAAGNLINCLTHKGDLYDAERYAQVTLDSLKDPANGIDQDSEAVATGYSNLGTAIWNQKGDLVRAEMLARESLRIRTLLDGNNHYCVGESIGLLANILRSQGNLGDEVRTLYERSLAIHSKHEGPHTNTAICNIHLGQFYLQRAETHFIANDKFKENLLSSEIFFNEALRI
jgi:hypothetical protein